MESNNAIFFEEKIRKDDSLFSNVDMSIIDSTESAMKRARLSRSPWTHHQDQAGPFDGPLKDSKGFRVEPELVEVPPSLFAIQQAQEEFLSVAGGCCP